MTNQHHVHGGTPDKTFARVGMAPQKVLDFSVNVGPLGVPATVTEHWPGLLKEVQHYPSLDGEGVIAFYRQKFGLSAEMVLPGNGSSECLYLVPRVLGFKKMAIVMPSFHDYERSCHLADVEITPVFLKPENGFSALDTNALTGILQETDGIMLGNPNNPTGTTFDPQTVLDLADQFPDRWFLIDEAFNQFLDDFGQRTLMRPDRIRRNILVFHSLTKFYTLPGVRLGCVMGHPETISKLKAYKEPWTVNSVAEKIAPLLLECYAYEEELRALIRSEKEKISRELGSLNGIRLFDATANFYLGQWTATEDLDDLIRSLLTSGLHLRDCRNFSGLEHNYFRFVVNKAEENQRLITAIRKCVNESCIA